MDLQFFSWLNRLNPIFSRWMKNYPSAEKLSELRPPGLAIFPQLMKRQDLGDQHGSDINNSLWKLS
jgi:hypothetical protein